MKKKIFLTILVVMVFTCLFAISINAAGSTENTYGEITPIEGVTAPTVIDSTSKVVILATDGTYYTFPSYYVLVDNATFTWNLLDSIKTLTGVSNASSLKNYIVRMEIPEGITGMSTGRFESSTSVLSVKFPTTLTGELGAATFKNCTNLTTVENLENTTITSLSVSNKTNRGGVFPGCTSLTSVSLPSTITAIGKWSFTDCSNLKTVNIPTDAKITFIGEWSFEKAKSLESFYFPSTLETLEAGVFAGCTSLAATENFENTKVTALKSSASSYNNGSGVFANCSSLTTLQLPSTLETIDGWAAASCTSLATLTIPENAKITYIGKYAFEKAIFTEVYLPSTLETLEAGAFSNCSNLTTVKNLGNTQITQICEYTFQNCPLNKIELPSTLQGTIGQYAFGGHRANQDKLVIPNGVTSIAKCAFAGANNNSYVIKELVLSANLESFSEYALEKNRFSVVYMPATLTSLPNGLFSNWASNFVVVYTGTREQLDTLIANTNTSANGNFTTDAVKNIKSAEEYGDIVVANVSGKSIVYGYDVCKAFYNNIHDTQPIEGNPCQGQCKNCQIITLLKNPQHSNVWSFTNENGETASILAKMIATEKCEHCGTVNDTDEIEAIFTTTGYSFKEEDSGVYQKTKVNKNALDKYAKLSGNENSYDFGIVAGLAQDKDGNEISGDLISVQNDVVSVKNEATTVMGLFANTNYSIVEIKLVGVQAGTPVYCGAFIVVGNNVTYVCGNNQGGSATKVTY